MADLLGSILNSMEKPPSVGEKEKKLAKERKAKFEKMKEEDRKRKNAFREKIEEKINTFINDSKQTRLKLEHMEKISRSIVHDIADVAGLTSFSFGLTDDERYVMLFKKEYAPSDEELEAYRRGEEWSPEIAKEKARLKALEEAEMSSSSKKEQFVPASNYRDKYKKLIGEESAKEAAHNLTPNKQFGFVPSANKKDKRSVEETLNEIRAKKKLKQTAVDNDNEETTSAVSSTTS
ncbi:sperm-associated antigen 7-like [Anneissia japonica]|uniref:sperm-associated antigen 7-like n=1 Tax=Anneissia japonica TaxID=1529436 RepID=UPI001425680E|nr:sperm-associated antigen 7-like [Anneissia japonica]